MAPPPSGGSKVAVVVLSAVLGLFVLISGVVGALYVRETGNTKKQGDQIASLQVKVDDLQRRVSTTERDLSDAQSDLTQANTDKGKLTACLDAIFEFFGTAPGSAEEQTAQAKANDLCRQAGY